MELKDFIDRFEDPISIVLIVGGILICGSVAFVLISWATTIGCYT